MFRVMMLMLCGFGVARAETYLPQPDLATAQARSQAQCAAVKCDGTFTKYWWSVQSLTDGTAAIVILPGTPFDVSTTVNGKTGALTAGEQASVIPATTLASKLPWVLPQTAFQARLTPPQLSALNASIDPAVSVPWGAVKKAATVDLTDPAVVSMVKAMTANGILTQGQALTLLTPVVVAVVP